MTKHELYERATTLPLTPGVYIMKDRQGIVIYVGKSKVLRQRVSQYFGENEHNIKTARMVSNVYEFEYMLTDTEMEALALENKLIKLYKPKYNIKLKDSKSYPYIKVTLNAEYPQISVVRKREEDNCRYFGPYSSIDTAYQILHTVEKTFLLPSCKRVFPRDIGKERPCIYKQLGQCIAPCDGSISSSTYKEVFAEVIPFLRGNINSVKSALTEQMNTAADNLLFENAVLLRDRLHAIDRLLARQKAVSDPNENTDIFALYTEERCSCINVFYIRDGYVIDSEFYIFTPEQLIDPDSLVAFISGIYSQREYIPKDIFFSFFLDFDNISVLSSFLSEKRGKPVTLKFPQKGKYYALCNMVKENAALHAKQYLLDSEKDNTVLIKLAQTLCLEVVPENIEAYDISNMGNDAIVGGKISVINGKFSKENYRSFNIKYSEGQDDYASMRETISRRLSHTEDKFPDLILLDGGHAHVSVIKALLEEMNIDIPVFGMVKDDFHKTRALCTESEDISIAKEQSLFNFIYKIQEEIHRFTIGKMSARRSKAVKHSSLEEIHGIGERKAKILLSAMKNITAIKKSTDSEGNAFWEWNIGGKTKGGNYKIEIASEKEMTEFYFTVTN